MERHEPMDVFILHEGKVYASHYKNGSKSLCGDECDLTNDRHAGCHLIGHQRGLCGKLDAYWKEVKA